MIRNRFLRGTLTMTLAVILLVGMIPGSFAGAEGTNILAYAVDGGNVYFDTLTGRITDADKEITWAEIPSSIQGIPVTGIGDRAFLGCELLSYVGLPYEVSYIGEYAFAYCSSIYEIFLPGGLEYLGRGVFEGCYGLNMVEIHSYLSSIAPYTFNDCYQLSNMLLPDHVESIGEGAFRGCNFMYDIWIPGTVKTIEADAFADCWGLRYVYYNGTKEMWKDIQIASGNDSLFQVEMIYLLEPEEPQEPTVTVVEELKMNHSLDLCSDISINYVVPKAALEDYDSYSVTCQNGDAEYWIEAEIREEYVYFSLEGLNALQMNECVEATLMAYKDGEAFSSPFDSYSIAEYAYSMMDREDVPEKVKRLCANLLRYGAQAQRYKDYNTDSLPDANLTQEQREYLNSLDEVLFADHYEIFEDLPEPTVLWRGKTLVLDSTVAVKLVVDASDFAGTEKDLELRVSYRDVTGEVKSLTYEAEIYSSEGKLYMFVIEDLVAAELRSVLTCRVYAGEEAVSQTMTYSPDSYCNGKSGELLLLCQALFAYVDGAKAYFGA